MEWREIVGLEGQYQVSEHGDIRSCHRMVKSSRYSSGWKLVRERILKRTVRVSGHIGADTTADGRRLHFSSHIEVAKAFIGPRPEGQEVRHRDGKPSHNHYSNLEYGTRRENVADAIKHGTFPRGEKNGVAKLTNAAVRRIKRQILEGGRTGDLAAQNSVSPQAISDIKAGRNWAHIEPELGF